VEACPILNLLRRTDPEAHNPVRLLDGPTAPTVDMVFFFPQEECLFERSASGWTLYTMESGHRQRTNKRFLLRGSIAELPTNLCRATVVPLAPGRYVLSNFGLEAPTPPVHSPSTLAEYIEALPPGL
jgi:hypothetical protein